MLGIMNAVSQNESSGAAADVEWKGLMGLPIEAMYLGVQRAGHGWEWTWTPADGAGGPVKSPGKAGGRGFCHGGRGAGRGSAVDSRRAYGPPRWRSRREQRAGECPVSPDQKPLNRQADGKATEDSFIPKLLGIHEARYTLPG